MSISPEQHSFFVLKKVNAAFPLSNEPARGLVSRPVSYFEVFFSPPSVFPIPY